MAGLGESCSHVASLLWVISVGVERREALTSTQKSAYWVMPPAFKSVQYSPVKEIMFIGKKRKASDDRNSYCSVKPKKEYSNTI